MLNQLSLHLARNYVENILRVKLQKQPVLKPLVFAYYITNACNFQCSYCTYYQEGQTKDTAGELGTADTIRLLRIIRKSCPNLYLTGGEPLLRRDIVKVLGAARGMGFRSISMVSNMSLIHRKMEVLDLIDNLTVSLDMVDPEAYAPVLGVSPGTVTRVIENIIACARLQKAKKFNLTVNLVLNEATLPHARDVVAFCIEHDVHFSMGPEVLSGGKVKESLRDHAGYRAFIAFVRETRKKHPLILDTDSYLDAITSFGDFTCYPLLGPRVEANGDFLYPCKPFRSEVINLLAVGSYAKLVKEAAKKWGAMPDCPGTCHMNCYLLPSQFVQAPLKTIREFL